MTHPPKNHNTLHQSNAYQGLLFLGRTRGWCVHVLVRPQRANTRGHCADLPSPIIKPNNAYHSKTVLEQPGYNNELGTSRSRMLVKQNTLHSTSPVKDPLTWKALPPKCHGTMCRIQTHAVYSSLLGPRAHQGLLP